MTDVDKPKWWKLTEQARWMLKGAAYALAGLFVLWLCVMGWLLYIRSLHGQIAFEYIQNVIQQQQAQQKATPPAKP